MCGIIGIVGRSAVNQDIYDALTVLQHRGQDAAGIATCDGNELNLRKDNGLVRDVFRTRHMLNLRGNIGIGHVRYPTAGSASSDEAQPFYCNAPYGITLAHNGNLTNAKRLKKEVFVGDLRHVNTDSDSEILLNVFAHELQKQGQQNLKPEHVFEAVRNLHRRCRGGYAAVAMIIGYGIVAFRDPLGIRPVCFGRRDGPHGSEYMIASESVALDVLGFDLVRDLHAGEAVYIEANGTLHTCQCVNDAENVPCIFEYVYLSRPDSIIDNVSVYKARLRMGEALADRIIREWGEHDIDVVIPIPDTSRTAALPLAYKLGVKYREGFIKNRYIGRTFIMPGQQQRKKSVRQKLNAIDLEFENKNVLLVDDSIVRGTTSEQIIQMAREAGAKKVYFASASPPVTHQNVYGIDMPAADELVAHNRSAEDVATIIGADRLIYQSMADLVTAVNKGNPELQHFDMSCFNGTYVTGDVTEEYLNNISLQRNDQSQQSRRQSMDGED